MTMPVRIVAALRTPQGRFLGALARRTAVELGVAAARAAMAKARIDPAPRHVRLYDCGKLLT